MNSGDPLRASPVPSMVALAAVGAFRGGGFALLVLLNALISGMGSTTNGTFNVGLTLFFVVSIFLTPETSEGLRVVGVYPVFSPQTQVYFFRDGALKGT